MTDKATAVAVLHRDLGDVAEQFDIDAIAEDLHAYFGTWDIMAHSDNPVFYELVSVHGRDQGL